MRKFLILFLLIFSLVSCNHNDVPIDESEWTVVCCPAEIANRAFSFAELYEAADTIYEWGGQDPVRSAIGIDCSGLVVMCYKYALVDTRYSLILPDMSSGYIYQNAANIVPVSGIRKGDLIFMGEKDSLSVTHIALFDRMENGRIYFIDSTEKDDINGVTRRFYDADDARFKAFGQMKLKMF